MQIGFTIEDVTRLHNALQFLHDVWQIIRLACTALQFDRPVLKAFSHQTYTIQLVRQIDALLVVDTMTNLVVVTSQHRKHWKLFEVSLILTVALIHLLLDTAFSFADSLLES